MPPNSDMGWWLCPNATAFSSKGPKAQPCKASDFTKCSKAAVPFARATRSAGNAYFHNLKNQATHFVEPCAFDPLARRQIHDATGRDAEIPRKFVFVCRIHAPSSNCWKRWLNKSVAFHRLPNVVVESTIILAPSAASPDSLFSESHAGALNGLGCTSLAHFDVLQCCMGFLRRASPNMLHDTAGIHGHEATRQRYILPLFAPTSGARYMFSSARARFPEVGAVGGNFESVCLIHFSMAVMVHVLANARKCWYTTLCINGSFLNDMLLILFVFQNTLQTSGRCKLGCFHSPIHGVDKAGGESFCCLTWLDSQHSRSQLSMIACMQNCRKSHQNTPARAINRAHARSEWLLAVPTKL